MYPHQADRLTSILEREGFDALVASSPENIAYVTGFRSLSQRIYRGTPIFAVFSRRATALVVPVIDVPTVATADVDVDRVVSYGEFHLAFAGGRGETETRIREWTASPASNAADALASALDAVDVRHGTVGLDDGYLAFDVWHRAGERLAPLKVVAARSHFATARMVKGPYELELLERALGIAEAGANEVIQQLRAGMTERDAVTLYEETIAKRGAVPYATIVAGGERSAIPAPVPSERPLRPRDLVRLEVGCIYKGYCADLARTAVIGEPDRRHEDTYAAVQTGIEAAVDAVKAGAPAGRIFDVAVQATRDAGLADYRRHHVGHGIGLEPYEPPMLAAGDDTELEAGMVVRIETPYYEIGWGGVTVMDTVLVMTQGSRVMNRAARGLVVLD